MIRDMGKGGLSEGEFIGCGAAKYSTLAAIEGKRPLPRKDLGRGWYGENAAVFSAR